MADLATRVDQYVRLRDLIKQKNDAHKKEMAPLNETLEQLNQVILADLEAVGADSVGTAKGIAYRIEKKSATIEDKQAFWDYVIVTGDWDLLDYKANATAIDDFIKNKAEQAKADPNVTIAPP